MTDAADLIRSTRRSRGWSQRDLAQAAGVPRSLVGAIEAGNNPKWATVDRLLAAAGAALTTVVRVDHDATDTRIRTHLLLHPLDRLDAHARAAHWTIDAQQNLLDLLIRFEHMAVGPLARMFWVPPGMTRAVAGPHVLTLAPGDDPAKAALPPWAWDACEPFSVMFGRWFSPRIAAARDLALSFAGDPLLIRAAEIWDRIRDVDTADRRDPAHRDPAIGDRAGRAIRPVNIAQAGTIDPPVRRPPWSQPSHGAIAMLDEHTGRQQARLRETGAR